MVHNEQSCREVAFFYDKMPVTTEPLKTEHAIYPNGEKPQKGQPTYCWNCGALLVPGDLIAVYQDEDLPRPRTIVVVDNVMSFNISGN
jgi:hypothetical protein